MEFKFAVIAHFLKAVHVEFAAVDHTAAEDFVREHKIDHAFRVEIVPIENVMPGPTRVWHGDWPI